MFLEFDQLPVFLQWLPVRISGWFDEVRVTIAGVQVMDWFRARAKVVSGLSHHRLFSLGFIFNTCLFLLNAWERQKLSRNLDDAHNRKPTTVRRPSMNVRPHCRLFVVVVNLENKAKPILWMSVRKNLIISSDVFWDYWLRISWKAEMNVSFLSELFSPELRGKPVSHILRKEKSLVY